MLYEAVGADGKAWLAAVLIRGDLDINEVKLPKALGALHVKLVSEEILRKVTGTRPGFVGPLGLLPFEENPVLLFVDRSLAHAVNVWCGANKDGLHHSNVSIPRDVMSLPSFKGVVEVATAREGDPSPIGPSPTGADRAVALAGVEARGEVGTLHIKRGIEVGHIFKLGTKYSEAMKCEVANQAQKMVPLSMGCYGLGLGRTIAAAVEQHHDEYGIVWPVPLAPFACVVAVLQRDAHVLEAADRLYDGLKAAGVEVFYDDRDERPGVKFKDIDLIGFPVRVVVGGKGLAKGVVEVSTRREKKAAEIAPDRVVEIVKKTLAAGAKTLVSGLSPRPVDLVSTAITRTSRTRTSRECAPRSSVCVSFRSGRSSARSAALGARSSRAREKPRRGEGGATCSRFGNRRDARAALTRAFPSFRLESCSRRSWLAFVSASASIREAGRHSRIAAGSTKGARA